MRQVQAKVITTQNGLTLVEWMDGTKPSRAWVTPDMIEGEPGRSALITHPEGGIPYGERWSTLTSGYLSAEEIETQMYRSGLWTVEDLQQRPNEALGVIRAVAGNILQEILHNARAVQKEARN